MSEKQDGARTIVHYGEGEAQFLEQIFGVFTVKPAIFKTGSIHYKNSFVLRFSLR